ncbi:hypothetical protein SS53G_5085 [Shigella sonnei 53G]|nr:hypothetical protein SS53G_5085 [Shigella sonnei 53G]
MPFYFRKECPLNSGYLTTHPIKSGVTFSVFISIGFGSF